MGLIDRRATYTFAFQLTQAVQELLITMTLEDKLFYPSPRSSSVPDFKSSTLIVPSVSIGNVPQLAIDLLITTLNIPLVGYMTSPYLVPCAGTREESSSFGHGGIACPLEGKRKLTVLIWL